MAQQLLIHNIQSLESAKQEEVKKIYAVHYRSHSFKFPFSVRQIFAQPVEKAVCNGNSKTTESGLDPRNFGQCPSILNFLNSMIGWMQKTLDRYMLYPGLRNEIMETLENFKKYREENPYGLFDHLKQLLKAEFEVADDVRIRKDLQEFTSQVYKGDLYLRDILDTPEIGDPGLAVMTLQTQLRVNHDALKGYLTEVVTAKIKMWKREHQMMMSPIFIEKNKPLYFPTTLLTNVNFYCNSIADLVWQSVTQVKTLLEAQTFKNAFPNYVSLFQQIMQDFITLFHDVLKISFVVEEHPQTFRTNEVLKSNLKATLLIGRKLIENARVKVYFIDKEQSKDYHNIPNEKAIKVFGKFMKKFGGLFDFPCKFFSETMTADRNENSFSVIFNKKPNIWKLQSIDRGPKQAGVAMNKYCFYFLCDINTTTMNFRLSTISFPVAVSTHSSQDMEAKTTIAWDNLFADLERVPFEVPRAVPWHELERFFNSEFLKATGKALTRDNLAHMKKRAFQAGEIADCANANDTISLEALLHKPRNGDLSFLTWFYGALNVITSVKTQLKPLWIQGYIAGFIDKVDAQNALASCDVGTFLFRFSDSVEGGISPVVLVEPEWVAHIEPRDMKSLENKHLATQVAEMPELLHLHLGSGGSIRKEDAFEECCNKNDAKRSTRYVSLKAVQSFDFKSTYELVRISPSNQNDSGSTGSDPVLHGSMDSAGIEPKSSSEFIPMDIQHNLCDEVNVSSTGSSYNPHSVLGRSQTSQENTNVLAESCFQQLEAINSFASASTNTMSGNIFPATLNNQNLMNFTENPANLEHPETATSYTFCPGLFYQPGATDSIYMM